MIVDSTPERERSVEPNKVTKTIFFTEGTEDTHTVPRAGDLCPIVISDSGDSFTSSAVSDRTETFSDDEDFCIIDSPGLGIAVSQPKRKITVKFISAEIDGFKATLRFQ